MKWVINLLFLFSLMGTFELKAKQKQSCRIAHPIVNLAGATSMILRELKLFQDPNLKGISSYFLTEKERRSLTTQIIEGGIFLSKKEVAQYREAHFLIDESQELQKTLKKMGVQEIHTLKTRGKNLQESLRQSLAFIKKQLIGCEKQLLVLSEKAQKLRREILELWPKKLQPQTMIFFLGEMKGKRLPQLILNEDGFGKELMEQGKVKLYHKGIDYSGWSQKLLDEKEKKGAWFLGLKEPIEGSFCQRLSNKRINIGRKWMLIPGLGQLYFLKYLLEHFQKSFRE